MVGPLCREHRGLRVPGFKVLSFLRSSRVEGPPRFQGSGFVWFKAQLPNEGGGQQTEGFRFKLSFLGGYEPRSAS